MCKIPGSLAAKFLVLTESLSTTPIFIDQCCVLASMSLNIDYRIQNQSNDLIVEAHNEQFPFNQTRHLALTFFL